MGELSLHYLSEETLDGIAVCLEIHPRKLLRFLFHEPVVSQQSVQAVTKVFLWKP